MSCITIIGMNRYWAEDCDEVLPRTEVPFTESKRRRLEGFARSDNPKLRAIAAQHPRTPRDVLFGLTHDPETRVRSALVRNPEFGASACYVLKNDEDPGIRAYARMVIGE